MIHSISKNPLFLLILLFFIFAFSCSTDERKDKIDENKEEAKITSEGILKKEEGQFTRNENGEIVRASMDGKEMKDGINYQEEFLSKDLFGLSEEEIAVQVEKLSPEYQEFYHRVSLRRDSMESYLVMLNSELKKAKPSLGKLTLLEKSYFEVKENFELDKTEMRQGSLNEFKISYTLLAKSMNDKLKSKMDTYQTLLKEKQIPPYPTRQKNR